MMSPGSSVRYDDMNEITSGTLCIRLAVLSEVTVRPACTQETVSACGSGTLSAVAIHGPIGPNPSVPLYRAG
jgi:hypothetical protein